jgi:hypothetical protein
MLCSTVIVPLIWRRRYRCHLVAAFAAIPTEHTDQHNDEEDDHEEDQDCRDKDEEIIIRRNTSAETRIRKMIMRRTRNADTMKWRMSGQQSISQQLSHHNCQQQAYHSSHHITKSVQYNISQQSSHHKC